MSFMAQNWDNKTEKVYKKEVFRWFQIVCCTRSIGKKILPTGAGASVPYAVAIRCTGNERLEELVP